MDREPVMLSARVPEELRRAVKIRAAEEGRSVAEVMERALRAYLAKPAKREK